MTVCPLTHERVVVATVGFIECAEVDDAVLRREVRRFGGRIWASTGGVVMTTFDVPSLAVRCVQSLRTRGVEIRAGMHAGQIAIRDDEITGAAVRVAAQVLDAAGDGTALVSRTVAELAAGSALDLVDLAVPGELNLFLVR